MTVQPDALVVVTVYVPDALTVIIAEVAVVLHTYVPPPDAVRLTLPPAQNVVALDGVIEVDAAGIATEPVSGPVRSNVLQVPAPLYENIL